MYMQTRPKNESSPPYIPSKSGWNILLDPYKSNMKSCTWHNAAAETPRQHVQVVDSSKAFSGCTSVLEPATNMEPMTSGLVSRTSGVIVPFGFGSMRLFIVQHIRDCISVSADSTVLASSTQSPSTNNTSVTIPLLLRYSRAISRIRPARNPEPSVFIRMTTSSDVRQNEVMRSLVLSVHLSSTNMCKSGRTV